MSTNFFYKIIHNDLDIRPSLRHISKENLKNYFVTKLNLLLLNIMGVGVW